MAVLQGFFQVALFSIVAPRGAVFAATSAVLFGFAICFGSNTVAHIHLHSALFRRPLHNRVFSYYLGVLLGVPQSVWRARHLWHHAGESARRRPALVTTQSVLESIPILLCWAALALLAPRVFFFAYLPGYALGMALCQLQGSMEHARESEQGTGVSHYGRIHNWLWFNDGHHAEHHRFPSEHWTRLPARRAEVSATESRLPPLLRYFERQRTGELRATVLCWLERLAFHSPAVRRYLLRTHESAIRGVLPEANQLRRLLVIGGGLFPRTALVLARLLPDAEIAVIDENPEHVAAAEAYLARHATAESAISFRIERFDPNRHDDYDLVVAPLAFIGARDQLLRARARAGVLTHDFVWNRAGQRSQIVSWLLLKRVNFFPGSS